MQRVKSASVTVNGEVISSIGRGLLVLAAVSKDDTEKDIESMSSKILKLKLWDDESKDPPGRVRHFPSHAVQAKSDCAKWKSNVQDIGGEVLCGMSTFDGMSKLMQLLNCYDNFAHHQKDFL